MTFHSRCYVLTYPCLQCGHLGGKVLVPASTHVSRLIAARFQLDLMQSTMLLLARTDAESGKLISSTVDITDHEFVIGTTTPGVAMAEEIAEAEMRGASAEEIEAIETEWMKEHELCTFNEGSCESRPIEVRKLIFGRKPSRKRSQNPQYLTNRRLSKNTWRQPRERQILMQEI